MLMATAALAPLLYTLDCDEGAAFRLHAMALEQRSRPHAPHIPHTLPTLCLRHLERYGCTKWTDEALDVIKQYSPLIEIGAGHGHWQRALEDKGADVVAFDNEASLPIQGLPNVGKVQKGDEKDVRKCVGLRKVQKGDEKEGRGAGAGGRGGAGGGARRLSLVVLTRALCRVQIV